MIQIVILDENISIYTQSGILYGLLVAIIGEFSLFMMNLIIDEKTSTEETRRFDNDLPITYRKQS